MLRSRAPATLALLATALALGACSSSFGGGSSPPAGTVVIQPGQSAVCADGSVPPCH